MTETSAPPVGDRAVAAQEWELWHANREQQVFGSHGVAAIASLTWLDSEPVEIAGVPGRWSTDGDQPLATGLSDDFFLAPGEVRELQSDSLSGSEPRTLQLRGIKLGDDVALLVFDPQSLTLSRYSGIASFDYDPAWVVGGRFEPADPGSVIGVDHEHGKRLDDPLVGVVRFEHAGNSYEFAAFPYLEGRLHITFSDETSGHTSDKYRFLTLSAPDADGNVVVDFNRAYLPPCSFSDQYPCPIPPAQNRLPFAVTAGETFPIKRD
ncbi:DUF1684 domain-containing protein [Gordonia sp. ABSL11-1]|uniref:DUF1684 domain-containing protein n=1 Tax=Gordonia sp. ABSL11-1 TaxID=3053924 RepID=UPI00257220A0|nr:DUF1684 domain-containing protein [Gordonia sp. ABSL11-1]MDL9948127.1 DUF1684 domain-containing protein [Gordonia sp. ABSL11-1]